MTAKATRATSSCYRQEYFFGEEYQTCCRRVHIVPGAALVLLLDVFRLSIETAYFVSKIGYLDSLGWVQLAWAAVGFFAAIFAFNLSRYEYLWPIICLKVGSHRFGITDFMHFCKMELILFGVFN